MKATAEDSGPLDTLNVDRIYILVGGAVRERIMRNSYTEGFNISLKHVGHFSCLVFRTPDITCDLEALDNSGSGFVLCIGLESTLNRTLCYN